MSNYHRVHFASPVLSYVVFPLNNAEYWALLYFEEHVEDCNLCQFPYYQLCIVGLCYARAVDSYMYYKDGYFASATSARLLLDIPHRFRAAQQLLRTLQTSIPTEACRYRRGYQARHAANAHRQDRASRRRSRE
jgi:hypothetical protein